MHDMLHIDGSFGEGGGQIIRSSLALSLVTGRAVEITNIRAGRKKPGLKRQHVTGAQAAAKVGQAEMEGASIGSDRLVFKPTTIRPGEYHFRINGAGSTTLVFQTVLPALMTADAPSTLILEGGTHNPFAPPFDFLREAYLPQLAKIGPTVEVSLQRYGFFPVGGGRFEARITPTKTWRSLELTERGPIGDCSVRSLLSDVPEHVGERECKGVRRATNWPDACFHIEHVKKNAGGPGNVLMMEVKTPQVTELFTAFGQRGVSAERVAKEAVKHWRQWDRLDVPVGEYLADQLMLPMAIAASKAGCEGRYLTGPLSMHSQTHIEVIRRFLEVSIDVESLGDERYMVHVKPG